MLLGGFLVLGGSIELSGGNIVCDLNGIIRIK